MKKLINEIELKFFEDDANGEWGLAHENLFNGGIWDDCPFNAFWGETGIFHDVWEHYFEKKHKYFQGEYALNVGGEMAAMGHLWYYYNCLGLSKRLTHVYRPPGEITVNTTASLIEEAIKEGYCNFGNKLLSNIPKQSPIDDYGEMDYWINKFIKECKDWKCSENEYLDYSNTYKKSITLRKVLDLHRWGYRQAERLVPNNWENRAMLVEFMDFWKKFCENNRAEDLAKSFKGITFKIYREKEIVSWKAILISKDIFINDYKITHFHNIEDEIYYKEFV